MGGVSAESDSAGMDVDVDPQLPAVQARKAQSGQGATDACDAPSCQER